MTEARHVDFDPVAARLNRGLTQEEVAAETQTPLRTIQRLEKGLGARPGHAKRYADFFGVQVTDLPGMRELAEANAKKNAETRAKAATR